MQLYVIITKREDPWLLYANVVEALTLTEACEKVIEQRTGHKPVAVSIANRETLGLVMNGGRVDRLRPPDSRWSTTHPMTMWARV